MKQTIILLTIILFSLDTYCQRDRDTIIITHHLTGRIDTTHMTTLNGWIFNQTEAKKNGLHIDSVTKPNFEFYNYGINSTRDTINSIINTDSTLIVEFNFVASYCGGNITCLISLDSNKTLNLNFVNIQLCQADKRYGATIHFRKINNPDIKAVMISRNRKTIKQIKK